MCDVNCFNFKPLKFQESCFDMPEPLGASWVHPRCQGPLRQCARPTTTYRRFFTGGMAWRSISTPVLAAALLGAVIALALASKPAPRRQTKAEKRVCVVQETGSSRGSVMFLPVGMCGQMRDAFCGRVAIMICCGVCLPPGG